MAPSRPPGGDGNNPDVADPLDVGERRAIRRIHLDPGSAKVVRGRLEGHSRQGCVRRADDPDRPVHDRRAGADAEEVRDESPGFARRTEPPERQGAVEARRLDRLVERALLQIRQHRTLVVEQLVGRRPRAVVENELRHELRPDVADVVDGGCEPASDCAAARRSRGEHRSKRPLRASLAPRLTDHAALVERLECPVDEGPRAAPHTSDLPVGAERAYERPAVRGGFDEQPEHHPFHERQRGAGRACQGSILSSRIRYPRLVIL